MAKFAERAAKGKTDVKEYKETLKNIQIISSNQKTIFDKVEISYFLLSRCSFLPEILSWVILAHPLRKPHHIVDTLFLRSRNSEYKTFSNFL